MSEWDVSADDWSAARASAAADHTVLIVDDDPSIRAMLGFVLDDEGFTVLEAADGDEALQLLETDAPDAMVLDLMMPRVDGHAVLRSRRDRDLAPDTRIVILTAKSDPSDAVWCWELGADEYVNKPVDPEQLVREVHMLLKRTPDEIRARRVEGLAEARRLDSLESAFGTKKKRR